MRNFTNAYALASEFIENPFWKTFWRTPEKLFKVLGWELIPYSKYDNPFLTTEAYSSYKNGNFYILYCIENYETRKNYNLHHEGGHIIGAHPIRFGNILCKSSIDTEKKFLEEEATIIGRNVFLPAYVIKHVIINAKVNINIIKEYFCDTYKLSRSYIDARFDFLEEDLNNMVYPKGIEGEATKELLHFLKWNLEYYPIKNFYNSYFE